MAIVPKIEIDTNKELKDDKTIKRINKLRTVEKGNESCYVVAQTDEEISSFWELEPYEGDYFKIKHKKWRWAEAL